MRIVSSFLITALALAVMPAGFTQMHGGGGPDTGTPAQLVETYDAIADTILAAKQAEWNLVHSILAMTYRHAEGAMAAARAKLEAGQNAGAEIEKLATLVSQLGNEGDAAVGAIRKRLVEGGHHHHASGEQEGLYDEGFVIVTKPIKKALLASAQKIGKMARSADAASLEAEWKQVQTEFKKLHEEAGG
jgi:riboflavin biosynthesis pyrimidine reductase